MPLSDPVDQARRFARVRAAHRTQVQADYVGLVADLIAACGEARAVDLAERLGVTAATVNNTLGRLKRDGLIESRAYRSIFLTSKGAKMAEAVHLRRCLIVAFLRKLGVSREAAEMDAEGLKHHVSDETIEMMREIVD